MWVDVVSLRREGVKLPPDEVRAAAPLRARLTMDTVVVAPSAADGEPRRADVAQLWAGGADDGGQPLSVLEYAQVSRVGGAGLLIVGVESAGGAAHPQAWWCRVVLPEDDRMAHEAAVLADWRDTPPGSLPATPPTVVRVVS